MKGTVRTGLLTSKLTTALAGEVGPEERTSRLARFIEANQPSAVASVIESIISDSCRHIDAALAFLSLMDRSRLQRLLPAWDWRGLDGRLEGTGMPEAWDRFSSLSPSDRKLLLARLSLLLEAMCIHHSEEDPAGDMPDLPDGRGLALGLLRSETPDRASVVVRLSDFPVESRRSLRQVLSELDFIEEEMGAWRYVIHGADLDRLADGENLRAHDSGSPVAGAMASRRAANLVKRFEHLARCLQMYPKGHPSTEPAMASFLAALQGALAEGPVSICASGETVMVNDVVVWDRSPAVAELLRSMADRQVSSITFDEDTGPEAVLELMALFNRSPSYIEEHGGLSRLVELRGLDSIDVNRYHYELVSGEEVLEGGISSAEAIVEDAIFSELIRRLEHGERIDSLSGAKLGEALKKVLTEAGGDDGERRRLFARFVSAVDPGLLERGLLTDRRVQRGIAWTAVRRIITGLMERVRSEDPDVRHEALEQLLNMSLIAVERGKVNTIIQVVQKVSTAIRSESDPDVLYRAVTVLGRLQERLLASGLTAIALEAGTVLSELEMRSYSRTLMESARVKALEEARRMMDSATAAERLVERLLSEDRTESREAGRLALAIPPGNLVYRLVELFHSEDRHLRARVFRILLNFRKRALPVLHERLSELSLGEGTVRDAETGLLERSVWFQVRNLVQVLREIGSPESEGPLAAMCRDADPRVRREGLRALSKVSRSTAGSLALNMLQDPDGAVAAEALGLVAGEAPANPAFRNAALGAYENPAIRREVLLSLDTLGGGREVAGLVMRALSEGDGHDPFGDPEVTARAFGLLAAHGGAPELEALETYAESVSGGFLRKSHVDRGVARHLGKTLETLRRRLGRA